MPVEAPVLTRIEAADYQSLRRVRISLGWLTVITGPTGSGKSGLIRAVRLLAANARGTGYIRRGAPHCVVALFEKAGDAERVVAIKRTAGGRGDKYRITVRGPDGETAEDYTKLGGQVPGDVARMLALGPLNFAGQFDAPYLLTATGTDIARTLGELTNVSMVFRAAAEAGRRRKGFERDAKAASARLAGLREQEAAYAGLEERCAAIGQAGQAEARMTELSGQLSRLAGLIARAQDAAERAGKARQAAAAAAPPSLEALERGLARYRRLGELMCALNQAQAAAGHWSASAAMAAGREQAAHQAVHDALVAAGHCPLCGQEVPA